MQMDPYILVEVDTNPLVQTGFILIKHLQAVIS